MTYVLLEFLSSARGRRLADRPRPVRPTRSVQVELGDEFLRVRLENVSPSEVSGVGERLGVGAPLTELSGKPDLTITWVDTLGTDRSDDLLGRSIITRHGEIALTPHALLRLGSTAGGMTFRCRQGASPPPLLTELAMLCSLERGGLPLHGVAVSLDHRGVVVVGPSAAGKTRLLLGLLSRRGRLIAAEHVVVAPDALLHGRSESVRARPYHLPSFKDGGLTIPAAAHRRLLFWRVATAVLQAAAAPLPKALQQRIASRLRDHAFVDVGVDVFPSESAARMRLLVLLVPTEQDEPRLMTIDLADAVERLAILFQEDIAGLLPVQRLASYACRRLALPSEMVDGRVFTDIAYHALQGVTVMTATVSNGQDPDRLLDAMAEVVHDAP